MSSTAGSKKSHFTLRLPSFMKAFSNKTRPDQSCTAPCTGQEDVCPSDEPSVWISHSDSIFSDESENITETPFEAGSFHSEDFRTFEVMRSKEPFREKLRVGSGDVLSLTKPHIATTREDASGTLQSNANDLNDIERNELSKEQTNKKSPNEDLYAPEQLITRNQNSNEMSRSPDSSYAKSHVVTSPQVGTEQTNKNSPKGDSHVPEQLLTRDQDCNDIVKTPCASFTKPHVVASSCNDFSHVAEPQHNVSPQVAASVTPPTIFMTYAEEPEGECHRQLIRNIAQSLSDRRIRVHLDMHETVDMSSSISKWLHQNIERSDFVIACVSPSYKFQVEGDLPKTSEQSLQSRYVYDRLNTDYIDNGSCNRQFIPILIGEATRKDLPSLFKNTICYKWPQDITRIIYRVYKQEMYTPPKLGTTPQCIMETHFATLAV